MIFSYLIKPLPTYLLGEKSRLTEKRDMKLLPVSHNKVYTDPPFPSKSDIYSASPRSPGQMCLVSQTRFKVNDEFANK